MKTTKCADQTITLHQLLFPGTSAQFRENVSLSNADAHSAKSIFSV